MAHAEVSVAMVLPDADVFGPAPVPAAPTVSGHSRVLSVEQVERLRSSPHLRLIHSAFRGSRERSQSGATSTIAQPMPRPPDGGHEGSDKFGR